MAAARRAQHLEEKQLRVDGLRAIMEEIEAASSPEEVVFVSWTGPLKTYLTKPLNPLASCKTIGD